MHLWVSLMVKTGCSGKLLTIEVGPGCLSFIVVMNMEFKDFSIIAWNVCGAFNKSSQVHLKNLIRSQCPSMMIILETHGSFNHVRIFWTRLGLFPMSVVDAQGHKGGIWMLSSDSSV